MSNEISEYEMRRALGLGGKTLVPKPKTPDRKSARPVTPKIRVILSVLKNGLPAGHFTHNESTLSQYDAIEAAKKAARAQKLEYWALIAVESIG